MNQLSWGRSALDSSQASFSVFVLYSTDCITGRKEGTALLPASNLYPLLKISLVSTIDQNRGNCQVSGKGLPFFQANEKIPIHCFAGFDFYGHQPVALLDNDINLIAVAVSPGKKDKRKTKGDRRIEGREEKRGQANNAIILKNAACSKVR